MVGPPGAGKTLLARAMPGILLRMTIEEALDVTHVYPLASQDAVTLVIKIPFSATT
jgi:magnesium chelatase family protein